MRIAEATPKMDVYTIVTNKIIEQLEKGVVPWKQPWVGAGIPMNLISRRPYRGINVWLLSTLHYSQNLFLTPKQLRGVGGTIKEGENSHIVVFWHWVKEEATEDKSEDPASAKPRNRAYLRYYRVYNISQCTGLPGRLIPQIARVNNPITRCEEIVENMPKRPPIKYEMQSAFYHPDEDYVNMPNMDTFINSESYYSTLFHELVHSTGHPIRLNRKELADWTPFGSDQYSIEELIAEIGACYLKSHAGIVKEELTNNVAYIQHWLKKLKDDKRFITYACSKAQHAADFVLNVEPEAVPLLLDDGNSSVL